MSEFKFGCPHCGQRLAADQQMAGAQVECPACKASLIVPGLSRSSSPLSLAQASAPAPPVPVPPPVPGARLGKIRTPAAVKPQLSGLSVASVVLGVASIFTCYGVLLGALAIVLGK